MLTARGVAAFWVLWSVAFVLMVWAISPGRTLQDALTAELLQGHLAGAALPILPFAWWLAHHHVAYRGAHHPARQAWQLLRCAEGLGGDQPFHMHDSRSRLRGVGLDLRNSGHCRRATPAILPSTCRRRARFP